jgi:hypothetical protein
MNTPIVEMVLQYRTLAKLNSTYCEGLLKVIGDDGRIHSSFNQTETRNRQNQLNRAEFAEYSRSYGAWQGDEKIFLRKRGLGAC